MYCNGGMVNLNICHIKATRGTNIASIANLLKLQYINAIFCYPILIYVKLYLNDDTSALLGSAIRHSVIITCMPKLCVPVMPSEYEEAFILNPDLYLMGQTDGRDSASLLLVRNYWRDPQTPSTSFRVLLDPSTNAGSKRVAMLYVTLCSVICNYIYCNFSPLHAECLIL